MERISTKTRKITTMGILLAMTLVLSFVENMLPAFSMLPPNTKLGLSNIIVMYTLFFLDAKSAYGLAVLKAVFVAFTRSPIAGANSLGGGLVSVTIMVVLSLIFKDKISYLILSVFGALGHNIGQMIMVSLFLDFNLVKFYWPIMLISGVIFGVVTGILLRVVMPAFNRISGLAGPKKAPPKPPQRGT